MDSSHILESLYLGSYPEDKEAIDELIQDSGITAVLTLQTDEDFEERGLNWSDCQTAYSSRGIRGERVPMRDFDYQDQKRTLPLAVKVLASLLDAGHTVYLHCNTGVGRSPLVAMAYLYWCRNFDMQAAIRHVKARRSCAPMTDLLEEAREDFAGCSSRGAG